MIDETHAPGRRSWVASANGHADFPIQNLPLGVFSPPGGTRRAAASRSATRFSICAPRWSWPVRRRRGDRRAGRGRRHAQSAVRARRRGRAWRCAGGVGELLDADGKDRARMKPPLERLLHRAADCRLHVPAAIGDYTDFFAGINHATNGGQAVPTRQSADAELQIRAGRLPRPRLVDRRVGHGRAPARADSASRRTRPCRPSGPAATSTTSSNSASGSGPATSSGEPIPIAEAAEHIAGFCLLNDWSARDIQGWEYQPLGPFLGKSFFTHRVAVGGHARGAGAVPRRAAAAARGRSRRPCPICWTARDQAERRARHRARGVCCSRRGCAKGLAAAPAVVRQHERPLLDGGPACGASHQRRLQPAARRHLRHRHDLRDRAPTVSAACCEISAGGRQPIDLPSGETRRFLEDGDKVIMRAHCRRDGYAPIGFGECRGTIVAAGG